MNKTKQLANNLHVLMCTKHHIPRDGIPSDEDCCWYLEDQLETCWEEPDHKEYLADAEVFMKLLGEEDYTKHGKCLAVFLQAVTKVSFASRTYPELIDFLRRMIVKAI